MNELGLQIAKLISGEMVVGSIVKGSILTNVFKLTITFDSTTGVPNINLLPYMHPISSEVGFIITMDKIITMIDPSEQIAGLYVQKLTEQIQKAKEAEEKNKAQSSENSNSEEENHGEPNQSSEN